MSKEVKFSTGLITFGNQNDRFCGSGYKNDRTIEEMFQAASKVKELKGLELGGAGKKK